MKKEQQPKFDFYKVVLTFLVGAISFAVALSYNNFAQAMISKYSIGGDGVFGSLVNLAILTVIALMLLYAAYRVDSDTVEEVI